MTRQQKDRLGKTKRDVSDILNFARLFVLLLSIIIFASFVSAKTHYINTIGGDNLKIGDSLYIDTANDFAGIGTLAPKSSLDVNGSRGINLSRINMTEIAYLRDTSSPEGGTEALLDGANYFYVRGRYAYVAGYFDDSFSVIDISDPKRPSMVGNLTHAYLNGAQDVYVAGRFAYVTSWISNRLTIIDISNPSTLRIAGSLYIPLQLSSVYVSSKYAYVTGGYGGTSGGLYIIDVSNPNSPFEVSHINDSEFGGTATTLEGARGVYVSGDFAYVAAYNDAGLSIINISNPANPVEVGYIQDDLNKRLNGPFGVYVSGSYAYVASTSDNAISIVNISNPTNPVEVGNLSDDSTTNIQSPRSIVVSGNYAYLACSTSDSITIIDVSNVTRPRQAGVIKDTESPEGAGSATTLDEVNDIYVSGKYIYATSYSDDGLSIIELTGLESSAANIGSLASSTLDVSDNAQVGNDMYIGNGLFVGPGGVFVDSGNGIASDGNVTILGKVGIQTNTPSNYLDVNGYIDLAGDAPITSTPPYATPSGGWKLGLYANTYAMGISGWTLSFVADGWVSIFSDTLPPANNGNADTPDTNAKIALSVRDGSIHSSKWLDMEDTDGFIDLWDGTDSEIHFGTDPWGGGWDEAYIRYKNDGGGENTELEIGIDNDANQDNLAIYQYGTEVMTIDGQIGIRNTTPDYALSVNGDIYVNGRVDVSGSAGFYIENACAGWNMEDSTWIRMYCEKAIYTGGGVIEVLGNLYVGEADSDRLIVDGSGYVGMGVTNGVPGTRLAVTDGGSSPSNTYIVYADQSNTNTRLPQYSAGTCYAVRGDATETSGTNYGVYGYAVGDDYNHGIVANGTYSRGVNVNDGNIYGYAPYTTTSTVYGRYNTSNYAYGAYSNADGVYAYSNQVAIEGQSSSTAYRSLDVSCQEMVVGSASISFLPADCTGCLYTRYNLEVDGSFYYNPGTTGSGNQQDVRWRSTGYYLVGGALISSERFKENITSLDRDFSRLLDIEPKAFKEKGDTGVELFNITNDDGTGFVEERPGSPESDTKESFGYIAEELDALGLRELVIYDNQSRPDSIHLKYRIPIYVLELLKTQQKDIDLQNVKRIKLVEEQARQQEELSQLRTEIDYLQQKIREI